MDGKSKAKEFSKKRPPQSSPSGRGNQPTKKACYDSTTYHGVKNSVEDKVDAPVWKEVFAPPPVLKALADLGFSQPTEIQVL